MSGAITRHIRPGFFGACMSLALVIASLLYFQTMVGWENLAGFLPGELAVVVLGLSAPHFVVWMIVYYLARGRAMNAQTAELLARMDAMVRTSPGHDRRVERAAAALDEQAKAMDALSVEIEQRLSALVERIAKEKQELMTLQEGVLQASEVLSGATRAQADNLGQATERLSQAVADSQAAIQSQTLLLGDSEEKIRDSAETVAIAFSPALAAFERAGDKIEARAESLSESLRADCGLLSETLTVADEAGGRLATSLRGQVQDLAEVSERMVALSGVATERFRQQQELIASAAGRCSEQTLEAGKRLREEAEVLGRLAADAAQDSERLRDMVGAAQQTLGGMLDEAGGQAATHLESYRLQVEAVSRTAAEQSGTLEQRFTATAAKMTGDLEGLAARFSAALAGYRQQSEALGTAAADESAKAESRVATAGAALAEELESAGARAEELLAQHRGWSDSLTERALSETENIEQRLAAAAGKVTTDLDGLATRVQAVLAEYRHQAEALSTAAAAESVKAESRVAAASAALTEDLEAAAVRAEALLAQHRSWSNGLTEKAMGETEKIEQRLAAAGGELVTQLEGVGNRVTALVSAWRAATESLKEAADQGGQDLATQLRSMGEAIAQRGADETARIAGAAQEVGEALEAARAGLAPQSAALREMGDRISAQAQAAGAGFDDQIAAMRTAEVGAAERLAAVEDRLQGLAARMDEAAQSAAAAVTATLDDLGAQGDRLGERFGTTGETVSVLRDALAGDLREMESLRTKIGGLSESLAASVRAQDSLIDETGKRSLQALKLLGQEGAKQHEQMSALGETSRGELASLRDEAAKTLGEMAETTQGALKSALALGGELQERSAALEAAVHKAHRSASEVGESFLLQAQDLTKASETAARQARDVRQAGDQAQRDVFLKTATVLIEDLNSLAIDMSRIIEDDLPEDLWRRYHKGDRSIFARRMLRRRDHFSHSAVEQLFKRDVEFRNQATRFMSQFETLLNQANACDSDQVLSAAFLTADVGKVYLVLSRSLGREQ